MAQKLTAENDNFLTPKNDKPLLGFIRSVQGIADDIDKIFPVAVDATVTVMIPLCYILNLAFLESGKKL